MSPDAASPAAVVADAGATPPLCSGCVHERAAGPDAAPLVVLLPGDGQAAKTLAGAWSRFVAARRWSLLALECPRDKGCKGSYWQWDGDPAWVEAEIANAARRAPVDPKRVHLVGWSGGASYVGWRTQALTPRFASVVIHGGGIPPASAACASVKVPVYFLVGDANPLHHLARGLRDHYATCGHDVTWDLLPRAAHDGEWSALAKPGTADRVLDWMATRVRVDPPSPTPASSAREAPPSDAGATAGPAVPDAGPGPPAPARPSPPPRTARGCGAHGGHTGPSTLAPLAIALALALALARVRR